MDPTVDLLVSTAHSGSVYPLDSVRERRQSVDSDLSGAVGGQSLLGSSDSWFETLGRIPV